MDQGIGSKNILLLIIIFIIGLILGGVGGYFIKFNILPPKLTSTSSNTYKPDSFPFQTASVNGKITAVKDKIVTVQNQQTNQSATFPLSEHFFISRIDKDNKSATPSFDLKDIQTNKDVLVNLEFNNGKYEIIIITYTQPVPSLPTLPKPKTPQASTSP